MTFLGFEGTEAHFFKMSFSDYNLLIIINLSHLGVVVQTSCDKFPNMLPLNQIKQLTRHFC